VAWWHLKKDGINCLRAAAVNAVGCLRDKATAVRVLHKMKSVEEHCLRVGPIGRALQRMGEKLTIAGLKKKEKAEMRKDGFGWLVKRDSGIWLVCFCRVNVLDHCVCVDAGRGLILNSVEKWPVSLSVKTLRMCAGATSLCSDRTHEAEVYEAKNA